MGLEVAGTAFRVVVAQPGGSSCRGAGLGAGTAGASEQGLLAVALVPSHSARRLDAGVRARVLTADSTRELRCDRRRGAGSLECGPSIYRADWGKMEIGLSARPVARQVAGSQRRPATRRRVAMMVSGSQRRQRAMSCVWPCWGFVRQRLERTAIAFRAWIVVSGMLLCAG